jgi:C1A family cysteine protease
MYKYNWKKHASHEVDLRGQDIPIFDQKSEGSCTAQAGTGVYCFLLKQRGVKFEGSRNFLYYTERLMNGNIFKDEGASLHTTSKALVKYGICDEALWPYTKLDLYLEPPPICWKSGLTHKISSYTHLRTLEDMKECLDGGSPFIFGLAVYESFELTDSSGYVVMPKPYEKLLGGHALVILGYLEDKKVFIGRNSWGSSWGDHGYFYLPYEFMMDKELCSEQIQLNL